MPGGPVALRTAAGTPVTASQMAELTEDVIAVPRMLTGEGTSSRSGSPGTHDPRERASCRR